MLQLNCWISAKGCQEDRFKFPYKIKCPSGVKEFKNKKDVWDELVFVSRQSQQAGFSAIGECCFYDSFYFANNSDLVDAQSQSLIKAYLYSKESNTPPFDNIQVTPSSFIDSYMTIRDELVHIRNQELREKQANGK